jgi:diadenylate cyclase
MIKDILFALQQIRITDIIDVLLVGILIYYLIISAAKTRALPVIQGFLIILAITLVVTFLKLQTMSAILKNVVSLGMIALIVLYPSEIRRALYKIGHATFWSDILKIEKKVIEHITEAAQTLSQKKTGAIFVFERNDRLQVLIDSGILINADVEKSLIESIFNKKSPLHDGAIVIRNNKIISAGSYISNLSDSGALREGFGTRHRAALGLSEQCDAIVVAVSEERKQITMFNNGKIYYDLTAKRLYNRMTEILQEQGGADEKN